ncbi:MAG: Wadjet anti-phage system protein JetD domain-containing protein [Bacilli bacterium]
MDKYEKSKLSKGGTTVLRSIKLSTKDNVLKSYNVVDSYKYVEENDAVIRKLENKGFIEAKYIGDTFKSLTLSLDNIDAIYDYLSRPKPSDELEKIKKVISKYHFDNFINEFTEKVTKDINEKYDYPKTYFSDSNQLDLLLKIFTNLTVLDKEMKKRDFSVKYLGDSKLFESVQGKVIKIIRDFDMNNYTSDEEVLSSYNIVKNSSYALVKNKLVIKLNDVVIDLDKLGYEISLSDEMIKNLTIIKSGVSKIITVENLTSFYALNDKFSVIIYLAGFHNHTKQALLKKIYKFYPGAEYYHFSDIDAGGFWIYMNLKDKTQIPFIPYKMSVEELVRNKDNLKRLTLNDKQRLSKMLSDEKFKVFREVIGYMLDNNVKLEQEILD